MFLFRVYRFVVFRGAIVRMVAMWAEAGLPGSVAVALRLIFLLE